MLKSRARRQRQQQRETAYGWRPWWKSCPTRFTIQSAALRFPAATTMSTMRLTGPKRADGSTGSRSMPASPRLHYKTYPDLGSLNELNKQCSPANSVGSIPELPPLPKKPFPPMASSYAASKRADSGKKLPYVAGSYPVINIEDFAVGSLPKTVKTKKAPASVLKQNKTLTARTEFGQSLVIDLNAAINGCRDSRSERRSSYEDRTTTGRSSSRLTSPSMAHSLSWSGSDLKNKLRQSRFKTSLLQSPNVSGEPFGSLSQTSSPTVSTISLVDRCTNKRNNSDPKQGTTTDGGKAHGNKNTGPDVPPQPEEPSTHTQELAEELEEKHNIEKCLKWLKDVAIAKEPKASKEMTPPPHLLG
ncbi:Hypp26 [Branchiostoma lanceolatum]|uniref:Hypp26 protein n=1 Tax=Branchiostoma lanceolatum TaxID=7740 RepID=A0A8J9YIV5_BRALA|nr:Hypp26 [Branchiostoma lanceolatum]